MKCVIIGGAPINEFEKAKSYISDGDFLIYCDKGLDYSEIFGKPDLIVGDFDSHEKPMPSERDGAELLKLPRAKYDTDSSFAMSEALRRGFKEIVMLGVIGARLDHTLVNIYLLKKAAMEGAGAVIVDDFSEAEWISEGVPVYIKDKYKSFSLVNVTGTAKGIHIENAWFEGFYEEILPEHQYATSNEVTPGKTAKVTVDKGELLLIKNV